MDEASRAGNGLKAIEWWKNLSNAFEIAPAIGNIHDLNRFHWPLVAVRIGLIDNHIGRLDEHAG
ncbi:hypothetical protein JOH51_005906 [Rhizobium leguminosarum]|nr:hypothetical protein [Rhizobium leguminosarum]